MTALRLQDDVRGDAVFDETKTYRYVLHRRWIGWDANEFIGVFIGLNPSVADEYIDDRTVRKCINFARREGCGAMTLLNIFAYRSTDPKQLYNLVGLNPIGVDNDDFITNECNNPDVKFIVVAWGTHGKFLDRGDEVLELLKGRRLLCLGMNQDKSPKHPLYLSNNTKFIPYRKSYIDTLQ